MLLENQIRPSPSPNYWVRQSVDCEEQPRDNQSRPRHIPTSRESASHLRPSVAASSWDPTETPALYSAQSQASSRVFRRHREPALSCEAFSALQRVAHNCLRLTDDGIQVSLVLEALSINLVDVFCSRRARGKPAAASYDFQATDWSVVTRSASQLRSDRFASQARLLDCLRRQLLQTRLLLGSGGRIDARVVRSPELGCQIAEVLARIFSRACRNFGREQIHDQAVFICCPYCSV